MNRADKRALAKMAQKKNKLSHEQAKAFAQIMYNADAIRRNGTGEISPAKEFEEGEKVKMNVDLIKSRQNYDKMNELYKQFVEDGVDKVYTVHYEQNDLISFTEEPRWLFWSGDLLHLNEENNGNNQES